MFRCKKRGASSFCRRALLRRVYAGDACVLGRLAFRYQSSFGPAPAASIRPVCHQPPAVYRRTCRYETPDTRSCFSRSLQRRPVSSNGNGRPDGGTYSRSSTVGISHIVFRLSCSLPSRSVKNTANTCLHGLHIVRPTSAGYVPCFVSFVRRVFVDRVRRGTAENNRESRVNDPVSYGKQCGEISACVKSKRRDSRSGTN